MPTIAQRAIVSGIRWRKSRASPLRPKTQKQRSLPCSVPSLIPVNDPWLPAGRIPLRQSFRSPVRAPFPHHRTALPQAWCFERSMNLSKSTLSCQAPDPPFSALFFPRSAGCRLPQLHPPTVPCHPSCRHASAAFPRRSPAALRASGNLHESTNPCQHKIGEIFALKCLHFNAFHRFSRYMLDLGVRRDVRRSMRQLPRSPARRADR